MSFYLFKLEFNWFWVDRSDIINYFLTDLKSTLFTCTTRQYEHAMQTGESKSEIKRNNIYSFEYWDTINVNYKTYY